MNTKIKPRPGETMPNVTLAKAGGGEMTIGSSSSWQLVVVYRGKHCPLCRKYLSSLDLLSLQFETLGVGIVAISADTKEKAESEIADEGWRFAVGYGLSVEQMRSLGVYISNPRSASETDRPFSEPALFLVNPDGILQIIDMSNAPFSRPDLPTLLNGLKFLFANNYPIRGTA